VQVKKKRDNETKSTPTEFQVYYKVMQHGHVQQQQSPSLSHSRDFSHCQSNRMLQIIAGHLPERPKGKQFFAFIYFTAKGSNSRNKRK